VITKAEVEEAISNVRGAVMISYPSGIPSHDPVQAVKMPLPNTKYID
jgi:hypothetical protein